MDYKIVNLGTEKTFIGKGAVNELGNVASQVGKKALIIAGDKAWKSISGVSVEDSLSSYGVDFSFHHFTGYCSEKNVSSIINQCHHDCCDVLIGIGGGKCIDSTKSAADKLDLPCICVPTSCATCASGVQLCVWYDDMGRCVPGMFAKRMAYALIIDTEIIIEHGDERLLASGMMDALAKYPEIDFSMMEMAEKERSVMLLTADTIAKNNFMYIINNGSIAYQKCKNKELCYETEQMVYMNILETALVSNLVFGIHQLSIAHMLHDAVCAHFHDQRTKKMHGEMVATGVILQMYSNGYRQELIDKTYQFIKNVNGPTCLSELGIEPTTENRNIIMEHFASHGYGSPDIYARINKAFDHIFK